MNRTIGSGPSDPRARTSSPNRWVAAALAAALLAGVGTALLTRSDGAGSAPSAGAAAMPASRTGSTPPTSAGTGMLASPPGIRPATQDPASTTAAPDRLTITRLGIDMRVVPVGVARDGEMALPATPAQVGWYRYGPRPGDGAGATVLAAHLDMPGYGVGPIAAVDELRAGDVVAVRSAAVTRRYRVTEVRSIRKTTLDLAALFARDGPPVLHVVTCGGDFDPEKRRYDENVVVTAEPVA
ncbi:MAG TPA: class F sortase [Lapillicoccus sp.]|nr:class F sortase [Lapillicoccus sp.]